LGNFADKKSMLNCISGRCNSKDCFELISIMLNGKAVNQDFYIILRFYKQPWTFFIGNRNILMLEIQKIDEKK